MIYTSLGVLVLAILSGVMFLLDYNRAGSLLATASLILSIICLTVNIYRITKPARNDKKNL